MGVVNYSSFAKIVYEHMIKKDMTALANSFFSFLIDEPNYIPNDNGDIFTINSRLAREWFRCETNISPTLRGAAAKQKIIDMAPNYIGTVIEKLIYEDQQDVMYKELYELVKSDTSVPREIYDEISSYYNDLEVFEFTSRLFLYSLTQDNNHNHIVRSSKNRKLQSLEELVASLNSVLCKLPKPISIEVPEELDENEMIYVKALLEAYSDKEGVTITSRNDLGEYIELSENFSRQRKSYYAAESVRESLRDTFQEKDYKEFDSFKKDIYDSVIEVVEDDYPNGYVRMNKTVSKAASIPLHSLLSMLPGWLTPEVKKGACHMLVNDGDICWVKKHE